MDEKIVFVGACYPDEILNAYICENKINDIAANVFGWKIVHSMISNGIGVQVINEHKLPGYNKCGIWNVSKKTNVYNDVRFVDYGYINLPVLKPISKAISIFKELLKVTEQNIMVYSLHTAYLLPSVLCAIIKHKKIILVIPDLPNFMGGPKTKIRNYLKRLDAVIQGLLVRRVSKYIILSKYMIGKIDTVREDNSLVIEGICDVNLDVKNVNDKKENYILYSGAVMKQYGLPEFVENFLQSDIAAELRICGNGDYVEELVHIQENEKKISYLGVVNREQLRELQARAMLLVNPRSGKDEYTKYSFPSKTMEYLLSGTVTMMEKLGGIPDEYYDYLYEVEPGNWVNALREAWELSYEKKVELGQAGQQFVIEQKNSKKQGEKIKKFIYEN